MPNRFYRHFDFQRFTATRKRTDDYRSPFQKDRDRIIHSAAFRRLQSKTQVFRTGEYDFYRTRLTHSIEVGQIGRSICHFLKSSGGELTTDFFIDNDLVEAAGLAHDIGNAPFGHAGEHVLHKLMKASGGFEGNAQSLRIIAENIYDYKPREGMDPTRAFLDSMLKYKTIYNADSQSPDRHFLYDSQQKCLNFVHPKHARDETELSQLQSIECQIMECADDIAYSIDDIKDGIDARFITVPKIKRWVTDHSGELSKAAQKALAQLQKAIENGYHEPHLSKRTAALVTGCRLRKRSTFMDDLTNRYRFLLERETVVEEERKAYKVLAQELVFSTSSIHQLEHKGGVLLTRMFKSLDHNYGDPKPKHLLPEEWHDQLCSHGGDPHSRKRTICDFLAGMTDAVRCECMEGCSSRNMDHLRIWPRLKF